MRFLFLFGSAFALLGGCGSPSEPATRESANASPSAAGAAPTPATAQARASDAAPVTRIALDGEGLRLVNPETGAARLLAFGSDRKTVEAAVTRAFGAPSGRGRNEECPAGGTDFAAYGPLTIDFVRDRFAAWTMMERPGVARSSLATMDGITLGTKRAEAEQSRIITLVENSTLDGEFVFGSGSTSAAGGGFLSGTGPQARITGLFAGANCFFR